MAKKSVLIIIFLALVSVVYVLSAGHRMQAAPPVEKTMVKGLWITVFSKQKVLYSKQAVSQLLTYCQKNDFKEIYLQIFRAGQPFYQSAFLKNDEYADMAMSMGQDPLDEILVQAHKSGIKVYAWINVLSLAQNRKAPILREYGNDVLTRDRNSRTSIKTEDIDDSDRFYQRDDQLFLEPGDERVQGFMLKVVDEITVRYPTFDGLHLDYIRLPYPIPFIPDSRFMDCGLSYGFGTQSVQRFKEEKGLDPIRGDIYARDLHIEWDRWKRDQVTHLVEEISSHVRQNAPKWLISAAVVPGIERAYAVAYQDWNIWIQKNLVDYVVLMNYTRDDRLFYQVTKAGLSQQERQRIYVGVGAFLFKDPKELDRGLSIAQELNPAGAILFSYDDLLELEKMP